MITFASVSLIFAVVMTIVSAAILLGRIGENYDTYDVLGSCITFILCAILLFGSLVYIIESNAKKCECGAQIDVNWQYCAKCGKEIPE